ncbi:hypothetical protein B0I35DRAFT_485521 [Stachybotrys elegans]|uniref:Uncharacterized protein n=1 Tax=Stachybotrys elegans TaxID=80388 RepID=A0A8K0WIB7_9HYPO|nr:hypothetical protein B0I35DRAFT_485521 [Stachybotrys elegans]
MSSSLANERLALTLWSDPGNLTTAVLRSLKTEDDLGPEVMGVLESFLLENRFRNADLHVCSHREPPNLGNRPPQRYDLEDDDLEPGYWPSAPEEELPPGVTRFRPEIIRNLVPLAPQDILVEDLDVPDTAAAQQPKSNPFYQRMRVQVAE